MLAESRRSLQLTDKDGGHALCDRAALTEAINATLDSSFYKKTFVTEHKLYSIVDGFAGIVRLVGGTHKRFQTVTCNSVLSQDWV